MTRVSGSAADYGLFFMDAARYPYACGHGTIGSVKMWGDLALEAQGRTEARIETPAGLWVAQFERDDAGRVARVALQLQAAFFDRSVELQVRGKTLKGDLVCVGGYFVMLSRDELREAGVMPCVDVSVLGMEIIAEANAQLSIEHPVRPEVNTVDVLEIYWDGGSTVVYGDHHVDRSPCGTGTSAKMALLHHRGSLEVGGSVVQEGPLGTTFKGTVLSETTVGSKSAIVPKIEAAAHITGQHSFIISRNDPFPEGFTL